jgi:hypothetical protein
VRLLVLLVQLLVVAQQPARLVRAQRTAFWLSCRLQVLAQHCL